MLQRLGERKWLTERIREMTYKFINVQREKIGRGTSQNFKRCRLPVSTMDPKHTRLEMGSPSLGAWPLVPCVRTKPGICRRLEALIKSHGDGVNDLPGSPRQKRLASAGDDYHRMLFRFQQPSLRFKLRFLLSLACLRAFASRPPFKFATTGTFQSRLSSNLTPSQP
jgi:hypothetical protein